MKPTIGEVGADLAQSMTGSGLSQDGKEGSAHHFFGVALTLCPVALRSFDQILRRCDVRHRTVTESQLMAIPRPEGGRASCPFRGRERSLNSKAPVHRIGAAFLFG